MNLITESSKNNLFIIQEKQSFISEFNAKISNVTHFIFKFVVPSALLLAGTYWMMTKGHITESTAATVVNALETVNLLVLAVITLRSYMDDTNQDLETFEKALFTIYTNEKSKDEQIDSFHDEVSKVFEKIKKTKNKSVENINNVISKFLKKVDEWKNISVYNHMFYTQDFLSYYNTCLESNPEIGKDIHIGLYNALTEERVLFKKNADELDVD